MKIGFMAGYSPAQINIPLEEILEAERLGYSSVWTAEAWGSDAVTPATWILAQTSKIKVGTAIMQIPARSPAMTAMTAMTLDKLSGGRFLLGIGPSGPQVVEGWYGESYAKPMTRMREYIEIVRLILAREAPLTYDGFHYEIPYKGEGSTGLGRPLKSILHGNPAMPIYTAAITSAGVSLAAEMADGFFPVWMDPERYDVFAEAIDEGFSKAGGGKSLDDFDVAPVVRVAMGDDITHCRNIIKKEMALYIGGMGARSKNFYNDYVVKLGYEGMAATVQDLFLSGKKPEAAGAIQDSFIDETALVGPADHIRDKLLRWKEAGAKGHVGSMLLAGASVEALRVIAEELL